MNNIDWNKFWEKTIVNLSKNKKIDPEIFNTYISNSFFYKKINQNILIKVKSTIAVKVLKKIKDLIMEEIKKENRGGFYIDFISNDGFVDAVSFNQNEKSFENFIEGNSNKDAYNASLIVTDHLGIKWNPLFLYGSSGTGKTHLLSAVKKKIFIDDCNKKILFINSDDWGRNVIEKLRLGYKEIEDYKKNILKYDVFLFDDVQFLGFRSKTNEIFFSLFNFLINSQKQIILTADCNPEDLLGFEKRLISRFCNGLFLEIKPPNFETSKKIIIQKLKEKKTNIKLENDALEYVAEYFGADVRKTEGVINRIVFLKIMDSNIPTILSKNQLLKILSPIARGSKNKTTIYQIISKVSRDYKVGVDRIKSKDRTKHIVLARRIFIYLTREILKFSYKKIGSFIEKNHSTVINSYNSIKRKIKINKSLEKEINDFLNFFKKK